MTNDRHEGLHSRAHLTQWVERWQLTPDGTPFRTETSWLYPVRYGDVRAMLKVAFEEEELRGADLMTWWNGEGAARVFAHQGDAMLMERALGSSTLAEMVHGGRDDEASRLMCKVGTALHAWRDRPLPPLVSLSHWFRDLQPAAAKYGGVLVLADAAARKLLAEPQDQVVLHGDIHHGNVLDFGDRGWLAIDPKGLIGESGFDLANIFCNPDLDTAIAPGRLARQASVVSEAAGLERSRVMNWILAYAGLSAAWTLAEGGEPDLALTVANLAAGELATS
jgi:streptomycin 6-kinase